MASHPTVSVVMSVYNGARYLAESVESVLAQEGVDFEFIVVDDGSTDETSAILVRYQRSDRRLRVIRQPNAGLTRALIRGCAEATGELIARQDADDLSLPGRLKTQANLLRTRSNLACVSCWSEIIGPEGELLFVQRRPAGPAAATQLVIDRVEGPQHGSAMFPRRCYERAGGYTAEVYYAQDVDLWLRLVNFGQFEYVPEVLYRFRITPASISGGRRQLQAEFGGIVDELIAARRSGQDPTEILARADALPARYGTANAPEGQDSAAETLYFIGKCLLDRRDGRSRRYLLDCLRRNPQALRAWLFLPWASILAARDALRQ